MAEVLREALATDRPVVIGAITGPDIPTAPPRLTSEQVKKLEQSLSQGDDDAADVRRRMVEEGLVTRET